MTPQELIQGVEHLLSLPDAVARANELLESDDADLHEIADVIAHDPALSARLLRLVNSALYGLAGQVDSLSRAITMIGTDELRSLIIAASSTKSFGNLAPKGLDMDTFWHRSVYCGLVAKTLTMRSHRGKGEPQFLAGLLHDCGRLVLYDSHPETARALEERHVAEHRPLYELEEAELGFTAAEVGALLLESWHLPARICEAVRWQHTPEKCRNFGDTAHTLALALGVTEQVEPRAGNGPLTLEPILPQSMARLGLEQAELEQVAMDASMACFEVLEVLAPGATTVY
ncbi:HDOD domain-containing protein [Motiliproteus sp. SC1-56]|uniref:HDOD domain-containing protein n=1 Tax=Motiliproteus sp. SC1-56 TaxID=2799565 RepID=UPI001A8C4B97|nr:HDOD domain-containing protein [Motiliproteus sp. SC1-56]